MKWATLPNGEKVPALGLGTWRYGESPSKAREERDVIRLALDLGMSLIDTAEMYGQGKAEEVVGEAIAGRREAAFIVSKVYPQNASRRGVAAACERSLRRLQTDRLDLYLLHWRGDIPLAETMEGFLDLQQAGKLRHYGVSNFDRADMEELFGVPGGRNVATNQVLYNLSRRGIEWDLIPWLEEKRMPVMAYSPIEQAKLARDRRLLSFAERLERTPAQVALAWLLAKKNAIVIPKTSDRNRLRENYAALECELTAAQLLELDRLFPPPSGPTGLEML
ncbi:MAG: aldo/keto reductase [Verrucomicrobiota bacterium]